MWLLYQYTGNYPPEIDEIIEVSATMALENETLSVMVNETYILDIVASDPNDDDLIYYLNGTVPGASIDDSKFHENESVSNSRVINAL